MLKRFITAACVAFALAVIYSVIPFQANCSAIYNDVFRLHILANSDSESDQALKLKVRDKVLETTKELFNSAESKEQAERLVSENLQTIANTAYREVLNNGSTYKVTAQITKMYFTTRRYKNYTLPSGMYDALRITIGSGKGHNWWCVMYPSLCVSPQPDEDAKRTLDQNEYEVVHDEHTEYKFKIIEFFEKIRSFFT
jgi:stage II sporulation protein R